MCIDLEKLDVLPGRWRRRAESILSPAEHLRRRIGQHNVISPLRKPERLMSRAAADINDPRRRRRQVLIELTRRQLVPNSAAQQVVMTKKRSRQRRIRIRWRVEHGDTEW